MNRKGWVHSDSAALPFLQDKLFLFYYKNKLKYLKKKKQWEQWEHTHLSVPNMEPNDNQLTSFFHHHHPHHHHHHQPQPPPQAAPPTTASPTNGLLPNADASHILYPHSVASAVSSQLEPAKRKRGRPRKYGTPEQALAAKKAATASSQSFSGDKKPHSPTFPSSSSFTSKKSHSFALGSLSLSQFRSLIPLLLYSYSRAFASLCVGGFCVRFFVLIWKCLGIGIASMAFRTSLKVFFSYMKVFLLA